MVFILAWSINRLLKVISNGAIAGIIGIVIAHIIADFIAAIKEHISDWSDETKDDQGNKVIKQNGDRSYTPFDVPKSSSNYFF